ncbi:unnamed protein product [Haemonchus placei]|uniref:Uncharacterized protein n=1 Tax=Haemonchus placei TaxID=6290 RepID=A0A0N4VZJ3_HAEPC|nr:unnamed protein product [Haemonchus placei]
MTRKAAEWSHPLLDEKLHLQIIRPPELGNIHSHNKRVIGGVKRRDVSSKWRRKRRNRRECGLKMTGMNFRISPSVALPYKRHD